MEPEIMILRLLHIGTGVFWAGAAFYLASFVSPAATALGPDGGKFMQQLSRTNRLPLWMNVISTLSILTGLRLFMINYTRAGGMDWVTGHEGACFTLGGVFALGAYFIGLMVTLPAVKRMSLLAEAVAKAGGAPTAEQAEQIAFNRGKIAKGAKLVAFHLAATVILMAVARTV